MKKITFKATTGLLVCLALNSTAFAQRGGDRGGGDRGGGDRGMGGGGPGGGMMMMGGPGGPGGGMMMMGMGGGQGGGFDPSGFMARMDVNGNGMLDPDEMQGPARFFLDRIARNNPNIDLNKPIPIATLTSEFERMRTGRGGDGGMGGGWGAWGSWGDTGEEASVNSKSLVPGFGSSKTPEKVPGFGSDSELFAVRVQEEDMREADERLRRYDSNRDGFLDQNELTAGRFRDNPMQYDRNGDGKLSREELSVRYARIRLAGNSSSGQSSGGSDRDRSRGNNGGNNFAANNNSGWSNMQGGAAGNSSQWASPVQEKGLWDSRATYRPPESKDGRRVQGLPSWFVDSDSNGDGQVSMKEFASTWNETVIEKFLQFDTNQDGYITAKECLEATKKGILAERSTASTSTTASPDSASGASSGSGTGGASAKSGSGKYSIPRDGLPADANQRWVEWVEKQITSRDRDQNGYLSIDEWNASEGDFSRVDTNGDGRISLAEYYSFRKK